MQYGRQQLLKTTKVWWIVLTSPIFRFLKIKQGWRKSKQWSRQCPPARERSVPEGSESAVSRGNYWPCNLVSTFSQVIGMQSIPKRSSFIGSSYLRPRTLGELSQLSIIPLQPKTAFILNIMVLNTLLIKFMPSVYWY